MASKVMVAPNSACLEDAQSLGIVNFAIGRCAHFVYSNKYFGIIYMIEIPMLMLVIAQLFN